MRCLVHVATAVLHAEKLSGEAGDLGLYLLSERLRVLGAHVAHDLEHAKRALDDLPPTRDARALAHQELALVYGEATLRLDIILPRDEVGRLTPGGASDVVERARFRVRRLEARADDEGELASIRDDLQRALDSYEIAVDAYLLACAEAQFAKDRVMFESHALRNELERAKVKLLGKAKRGSDAWARIKRRTVRTKRPRWVDDGALKRFLSLAPAAA